MHIAIYISSLGQGGAERIASIMANYWVEHGRRASIVTLAEENVSSAYSLSEEISVYNLGVTASTSGIVSKILMNIRRLLGIRKSLRQLEPDVIVSFMDTTNVLVLLASQGLNIPTIVTEHCHPVEFPIGGWWGALRKFLYPHAAAVVVLGNEIKRWFSNQLTAKRLEIIQNPVIVPHCDRIREPQQGGIIIGAGRLVEEKQFGILIAAFAAVSYKFPDWSLVIYGEGPDRYNLGQLIREKGLEDRVLLPGWVNDLHNRMANADIFVLSSRSEAFPGALCEAMACGLPVVSFDCPSGPAEIIRPGIDGILVPPNDIEMLSNEMERLMSDEILRNQYGGRAVEVVERFSLDAIMIKWEILIQDSLS